MKIISTIVAVMISAMTAGVALSQDIVMSTQIGLDAFNDDQFDLQTQNSDTSAIVYRPDITLSYVGPRYQNSLEFGAVYNQFFDSEFDNTSNFNAGWLGQRNTATSNVSLSAGFDQRLVEDFLEFDDVNATATQIVETVNMGASYSINLSELNQVQLAYDYTETIPAENPLLDTVESVRHDLLIQWLQARSSRSNFGILANAQSYRPEQVDTGALQRADVDTLGLALVGAFQFNDRWNIAGNLGANQARIEGFGDIAPDEEVIVEDGDVLLAASAGATYTGLRNVISIDLEAGTTQQLDGVVDNQQSISANWDRNLRERWNSNVSARYFTAERDDRTNINVQASITWQQSPRLLYRLAYQFRAQEFDLGDDVLDTSNQSTRFTLTLEYSFEDITIDL